MRTEIGSRRMPPKMPEEMHRLNMLVPARIMRRVDQWRRKQPKLGTVSEDMRKVIEAGIEALESQQKQRQK